MKHGILFRLADFLSKPPGFYLVIFLMVVCTALVPFGWTDVVTYALSVAAIVITGVVLIQSYRDTAAIHAKLDELIIALKETRNDVVGLEHHDPDEIAETLSRLEEEAVGRAN
jgi:low affinity Fe/Cu permease